MSEAVRVLCASGSLGLTPFHEESFWAGVNAGPDVIAADAGSGDIGPFYLGSGHWYNPREWEEHDLSLMIEAAAQSGAKVVVGSAGGAGLNQAVDLYTEIIDATASRLGTSFKVARIYSEVDREWLAARIDRARELGAPWALTHDVITETERAVAMIGLEPYLEAFDRGADVVVAGRSCDDALFASYPVSRGHEIGLSLHMGKSIECGPLVATPVLQREAVMATVNSNDFVVEPLHPDQRCTVASVAGHTLYERLDPFHQPGPGGELDLTGVSYEPISDRAVRVAGARWVPAAEYCVKIEGATRIGARKLVLFALRDPLSIANVDAILENIREEAGRAIPEPFDIHFSVYGRDAVMGARELNGSNPAHEVAVLAEAVAATEPIARQVAKVVKYGALRAHYPGKLGTAGGAALPGDEVLSPDQEAYRWTIDHLVRLDNPLECCRIEMSEVGR